MLDERNAVPPPEAPYAAGSLEAVQLEQPLANAVPPSDDYPPMPRPRGYWWKWAALSVALCTLLGGGVFAAVHHSHADAAGLQAGKFGIISIPLKNLEQSVLPTQTAKNLQINGDMQLTGSILLTPGSEPATPLQGQLYYDKTLNRLSYYDGQQFIQLGNGNQTQNITNITINGTSNATTTSGGTANRLAKFTGSHSLSDSIISDDASKVTITGNLNLLNTAPGQEMTIWSSTVVPGNVDYLDNQAVEVGIKFQSDVDGIVSGMRFYKGPLNTGTHVGSLYAVNGVLLASVTFSNETASGWQDARFSSPVAIAADTTYIIAYHTDVGQYAADGSYFLASGFDHAPLHALQDGMDGGNGVFKYSATPTFPTNDGGGSNYWIDVDFTPSSNPFHYMLNGAQITSSALANNFDLAKRSSGQVFSGINTFRNVTDSGAGFSIQSANGTDLLVADTSAKIVIVSTLIVGKDITIDGHIVTNPQDSAHVPTIAAGAAACTTPTINVSGTDTSGVITITTGTGCVASGTLVTLTFGTPYGAAPHIMLTPGSSTALTLGAYIDDDSSSFTSFTLGTNTTPVSSTTYKWNYLVVQ